MSLPTWKAQLITAPADGIHPAILLTVGGSRLKGQYLFNIPEGLSRLSLEHSIRPSTDLRAAFIPSLNQSCIGGLGGLIMRLRIDGHGKLHIIAPSSSSSSSSSSSTTNDNISTNDRYNSRNNHTSCCAAVASLRHFIRWSHPDILVNEVESTESHVVYEDEHVAVVALWKGLSADNNDNNGGDREPWEAPSWLCSTCQNEDGKGKGVETIKPIDSSSSNEETSSNSTDSDSDTDNDSDSDSESESDTLKQDEDGTDAKEELFLFQDLDELFSKPLQGRQVLERLAAAAATTAAATPITAASAAAASIAVDVAVAVGDVPRRRRHEGPSRNPLAPAAIASAPSLPLPVRFQAPTVASTIEWREKATQGYESTLHQGISLYLKKKKVAMGTQGRWEGERQGQQNKEKEEERKGEEKNGIVGWIVYLKSTDQLLLITTMGDEQSVQHFIDHPALTLLQQQQQTSGRLAAAIHCIHVDVLHTLNTELDGDNGVLSGLGSQKVVIMPSATEASYKAHSPPAAAAAAAATAAATATGAGINGQDMIKILGHRASCRLTAKLNVLSPTVFPLPYIIKKQLGLIESSSDEWGFGRSTGDGSGGSKVRTRISKSSISSGCSSRSSCCREVCYWPMEMCWNGSDAAFTLTDVQNKYDNNNNGDGNGGDGVRSRDSIVDIQEKIKLLLQQHPDNQGDDKDDEDGDEQDIMEPCVIGSCAHFCPEILLEQYKQQQQQQHNNNNNNNNLLLNHHY
jgi:hypothetical protein